MATVLEQKKKQRILAGALLGVVVVTAGVLWFGFFQSSSTPSNLNIKTVPGFKSVEVNTNVLNNPIFDVLDNPRNAPSIPSGVGRSNPFVK